VRARAPKELWLRRDYGGGVQVTRYIDPQSSGPDP